MDSHLLFRIISSQLNHKYPKNHGSQTWWFGQSNPSIGDFQWLLGYINIDHIMIIIRSNDIDSCSICSRLPGNIYHLWSMPQKKISIHTSLRTVSCWSKRSGDQIWASRKPPRARAWNGKPGSSSEYMGVSENSGFSPQIIHSNRVFHYKPSILGYPYFWKHPNVPGSYELLILAMVTHHTFNDGNPYHGFFKTPILLGWWVYPLRNMEILGVDRPQHIFSDHGCWPEPLKKKTRTFHCSGYP